MRNKINLYRELPNDLTSEHNLYKESNIVSAVVLGFTTLVVQIILLREFLSVFNGNELVVGVILSNWMILTGTGAYIGRFINLKHLTIYGLLLIAVLPFLTAFALNFLKNIIYPVGSIVSLIQIFYNSFFLLLLFCVTSGILFTHLARSYSLITSDNKISVIYSMESLGSILGGIIFNIILIYFLRTFESLIVVMAGNFIAVIFMLRVKKLYKFIYGLIVLQIGIWVIYNYNIDLTAKSYLFPNQKIIYHTETPYGSITVTEQGTQKNYYENNSLLYSSGDVTSAEETVHFAMIQNPSPKNVMLISGGISGTINEILKYNVDKIDYVELNPWIISIGKKYTTALANPRVNTINEDARLFVRDTDVKYDVVIVDLPLPTSAQINRYYTLQFFQMVKDKLNNRGAISIGSVPAADYMSKESNQINSAIYNTLQRIFKNVLPVQGDKIYFIASDAELNINIASMLAGRGIDNLYVNQYYFDDGLLKERSDYILNNINHTAEINTDFKPVSYYQQLIYWLSYFRINYWLIPLVMLIIVIFSMRRFNAIGFGMFTGGFTCSGLEVLLILTFQIMYGYVYQMMGVIITIFFTGLTVGSKYYERFIPNININKYLLVQIGLGLYSFLFALVLWLFETNDVNIYLIYAIIFIMAFDISFLIGIEFALASRLMKGSVAEVASEVYSKDLIGAAVGALLVSVYLVPVIGVIWTAIIVGLLNFIAASITNISRNKLVIEL